MAKNSLHEGLKRSNPPGVDKSMGTKGYGSVDSDAVRKETAPTPKTLGPRDA